MTITVEKLSRSFGEIQAVKGIDLDVDRGETFGFLGPNGAGKSTTIKMLCTLLHPTSGRAWINGYDIEREASQVRQSIGIVFQDEPTVGLDPQTRRSVWEHVLRLRERTGLTIFMTTHYMEEAEYCDRIAIIDHGQIVALDTPAALKRMVGQDLVRLTTSEPERAAAMLEQHTGHAVRREGDAVYVEGESGQTLAANLIRQLTLADIDVLGVDVTSPTLEDVFVHLTGRVIRDESASAKDRMGSRLRSRGRLRR